VVIVEDQDDARAMVRALLELEGYEVHEAENGTKGLTVIERIHPDIALIDIGLPGIDGYDLARQLRKSLGNNHTYLVALTGYGPTILTRTTSEAEPFHPEHAEPGTVRHHIRVEGIQTPVTVEQNIKPVKFISQQITPLNSARTLIKEAIDTAAERQSGYSTAESRAYCNGLRAALAVMEATVASTE